MLQPGVMDMVLEQLTELNRKVDEMRMHGCSKAGQHDANQTELFSRVKSLELSRAEGKGRLAVAVAITSALITAGMTWLGKHL